MEAPPVRHARFRDIEAFAAAMPGGWVAAAPPRPAPFSAEIAELRLGDVALVVARSTSLLATGRVDPGSAWVVLPLGAPGALALDGRTLGPGDVALCGPGAEVDGSVLRDARWALLALPAAAVADLLGLPGRSPLRRPGATAVLRVGREPWARAASLMEMAAEVAAADPEVFGVAEAWRGLRDDVLDAVREMLAGS